MKNFLRNCIPLLLLAALSLSAAALRPGDVAGQVLATEIRAFIDGVEIPATTSTAISAWSPRI